MNWSISDLLSADCGYMYGENWNLQDQDIQKAMPSIRQAVNDVETIRGPFSAFTVYSVGRSAYGWKGTAAAGKT